jgi:hypothetical protein
LAGRLEADLPRLLAMERRRTGGPTAQYSMWATTVTVCLGACSIHTGCTSCESWITRSTTGFRGQASADAIARRRRAVLHPRSDRIVREEKGGE